MKSFKKDWAVSKHALSCGMVPRMAVKAECGCNVDLIRNQ